MTPEPENCQKYGVPLYGAAWVPPRIVFDQKHLKQKDDDDSAAESSSPSPSIDSHNYLVLSGGGGDGNSGIPNALLVSLFDFASYSLSDQPVAQLSTGAELPYRMAVHPSGEGLICSFEKSCRWYEWNEVENAEDHRLGLRVSEKVLTQLENVGQQLALTFSDEGSILAVGGEEGNLRVFKWPSMDIVIDEARAHASVKDLDFSPDGKLLVSSGSGGPCRVWDVASSTVLASLPKENNEIFGFCRFSQSNDSNLILYTTVTQDKGGSIVTWNTTTWKRTRSKQIVRDAICAFSVSPDGKFLAVGTVQGDLLIINSTSMQPHTIVKKAHLGFVTALTFSHDSRALVSVSMDSSARVTIITETTTHRSGYGLWVIMVMIILAIAAYAFKVKGLLFLTLTKD